MNEGGKYAFMGIWHSTKKENFKILQKDDLHTWKKSSWTEKKDLLERKENFRTLFQQVVNSAKL